MPVTIRLDPVQFGQILGALTSTSNSLNSISADTKASLSILGEMRDQLKLIASYLAPQPATSISIRFKKAKGENMPLSLPDTMQDTYVIVGKDAMGVLGAQLAAGQTLSVVSSDPATVLVTPDASPAPTSGDPGVPDGTPTVGSGSVKSANPPAQPNVAITVTATVTNADGSVAETVSDTVTITPGVATSVGELFGAAVPVTP